MANTDTRKWHDMLGISRMFLSRAGLGLGVLVLLISSTDLALGQDEQNLEINGFFLGNLSVRTTGQRTGDKEPDDFLLGEGRLRLDIFTWANSIEASAQFKADFLYDAVVGELDVDVREAYMDYTTGAFDFRVGRQIATWGVGDLLFINDVFPKDWVSFFSGRPLEYLKLGVDALRSRYSSNAFNAELLVIPFFTPDKLPTSERFFLFDPFAVVSVRDELRPATTFGNTEVTLRLYRKIGDFDLSGYAYRGFWRTPGMRPDSFVPPARVTTFYPHLSVYGFSTTGSALGGILSFESGYYRSRDDQDGDDPTVPNSQVRFLVGYQRQLWEDFTLGTQYYGEIMGKHGAYRQALPTGFPSQNQYRDTVTLRLEQLLKHQIWKLVLFVFYSPADSDYLVQPQMSHKFSDHLSATLGANIFGGEKDTTFLGQFDKNDNVYLSVRFDF
jgi:hypothetical protein